jgi:hypothetical protein
VTKLFQQNLPVSLFITQDGLHQFPGRTVVSNRVAAPAQIMDDPIEIFDDERRQVSDGKVVQPCKPHGESPRLSAGMPFDKQFPDPCGMLLLNVSNAEHDCQ